MRTDVTAAADERALCLGGFPIHSMPIGPFVASLYQALASGQRRRVMFANTNFVVQCQPLRRRLARPSVRIVNDGIGMDLAALMVHGRRFDANLNGTDLVPYLARHAPRPLRFFLLGAKPGVAERAAAVLADEFGQVVVGTCDGYGEMKAAGAALVGRINASHADVVLVAFGNPLQEAWILDHDEALDAPLVFGIGALLDFLAGNARRAPEWVRRFHLEWLYRLSREPRRLLKRYSVDLLVFFSVCLRAGRRCG